MSIDNKPDIEQITCLVNQQESIISDNISDSCLSIKGFIIDDCINRNVISSMLFIIPAIYGFIISWFIISIGSLICLFTSIINHYNTSQHKIFRPLDIVCVNSIAIYFVFFTYYNIGISFYSIIMYLLSFITLSIYLYIHMKPYLYKNYYCWVHVFAVTGIVMCIKSYDIHFNSNVKDMTINNNIDNNNTIVLDK
jgi:drug/metabolite transporter (DMT)-like permease